jgi:hypothetical protein
MKGDELPAFISEKRKAKTRYGVRLKEREVARLIAVMNSLPDSLLRILTVQQLCVAFQFDLSADTVAIARREYLKGEKMAGKQKGDAIPDQAVDAQVVLERIARITTKTYAHLGDSEQIGSEEASVLVYKELKTYDPAIITRNEKRALPK